MVGLLAPLPGARDTGPSPNRKWGAAVIAGRALITTSFHHKVPLFLLHKYLQTTTTPYQ